MLDHSLLCCVPGHPLGVFCPVLVPLRRVLHVLRDVVPQKFLDERHGRPGLGRCRAQERLLRLAKQGLR